LFFFYPFSVKLILKMHQKPDRPDQLGSLSAPPYPLAAIWGPTSKGRGEKWREKEGEREGRAPTTLSGYATEGRD